MGLCALRHRITLANRRLGVAKGRVTYLSCDLRICFVVCIKHRLNNITAFV